MSKKIKYEFGEDTEKIREATAERIVEAYWDYFLKVYWLQKCPGCPDGHSSFWRTVILSPQWKLWQEEQNKRMKRGKIVNNKFTEDVYDMSECEELGCLGERHFQSFLEFINKNYANNKKTGKNF